MRSEPDAQSEAAWLDNQRVAVEEYLRDEHVLHAGVGPEPAWYEYEVLAIWPVLSNTTAVSVGWWAISGDVPTDYLSASGVPDARAALSALASRWQAAAAEMAAGRASAGLAIGDREDWPSLAPMLASRAEVMARWAADAELWL